MALINCPECNASISSEAAYCPHCGAPITPKQTQEQQPAQEPARPCLQSAQPTANTAYPNINPPKTWLLESILATIFCCLPFGIIGIIYATKVESSWYAGRTSQALSYSKTAKTWTITSFVVGLVGIICYMLLMAFGVLSGIMGSMID